MSDPTARFGRPRLYKDRGQTNTELDGSAPAPPERHDKQTARGEKLYTMSYEDLRYNEVRQTSSHNAFQRFEGIYDQVLLLENSLARDRPAPW